MPFAGVNRPSLGIGNLKAARRSRGVPSDVRNFKHSAKTAPDFYDTTTEAS